MATERHGGRRGETRSQDPPQREPRGSGFRQASGAARLEPETGLITSRPGVARLQRTAGNVATSALLRDTPPARTGKALVVQRDPNVVPFVDRKHRPTDVAFATKLGKSDAADLRSKGVLGLKTKQMMNGKMQWFRGAAHDAYVDQVTPALREAHVQTQINALKGRQAATTQDLRWRGVFGQKLSSWRQAILRMAGGMDDARSSFQDALSSQAQANALMTQILLAAVTIGFAAGFEPLLSAALMASKIGGTAAEVAEATKRVAAIVERAENPVIAAVGTTGNIVGAAPRPGVKSSSPMSYLTDTLEALERHIQAIEEAFGTRAGNVAQLPDDAAAVIDTAAQEQIYKNLFDKLDKQALGVESLKERPQLTIILERYMWAKWFPQNYVPDYHPETGGYWEANFKGWGTGLEDHMNDIGIAKLAGVELTGHWYSSNSSGWADDLIAWSKQYMNNGETFKK
ncbi:hypothetical protein GCM10017690_25510 [Microbacterium terregens]